MSAPTYRIERCYFRSNDRVRRATGLTLEEAQAHCQDTETASRTCILHSNVEHTEIFGPWFDAYYEES